jgi:hypothetical protein
MILQKVSTKASHPQKPSQQPIRLTIGPQKKINDFPKPPMARSWGLLPKQLAHQKTYDFLPTCLEEFHNFIGTSLTPCDSPNGTEIVTAHKVLDNRTHVTMGRIGDGEIVLKRSKDNTEQNDQQYFHLFMDGVKQKLRKPAAIENDDALSEEKKSRTQHIRSQLAGLSNIVPIIGIAQAQHQNKLHPGTIISETVEIVAFNLSLQLAKTPMMLHGCSYTNTDSNPKNIMVIPNDSSFTPKLIDWGSLKKRTT